MCYKCRKQVQTCLSDLHDRLQKQFQFLYLVVIKVYDIWKRYLQNSLRLLCFFLNGRWKAKNWVLRENLVFSLSDLVLDYDA